MIARPTIKNNTETIVDEKPEPKVLRSKTVIPGEVEQNDEPIIVNFQDEKIAEEFISKPTKDSDDTQKSGFDSETTIQDVQDGIRNFEQSKSKSLKPDEYFEIAKFIVNLFDTGISTALNFFAKDTSTTAYSIPEKNKKMLAEQLALILMKYNQKFSIEFTFLLALIVVYSGPVMMAIKNRKANMPQKNKSTVKVSDKYKSVADNVVEQKTLVVNDEPTPIESNEPTPVETTTNEPAEIRLPRFRRRRGKQPKP